MAELGDLAAADRMEKEANCLDPRRFVRHRRRRRRRFKTLAETEGPWPVFLPFSTSARRGKAGGGSMLGGVVLCADGRSRCDPSWRLMRGSPVQFLQATATLSRGACSEF